MMEIYCTRKKEILNFGKFGKSAGFLSGSKDHDVAEAMRSQIAVK
jgi:hypothetical protein